MQVLDRKAGRGRDKLEILEIPLEHRRKLPHPREPRLDIDVDEELPGCDDLRDGRRDASLRDQNVRGAERRVPGERQLAVGSEDAHRIAIVAPVRDERRLRETDLPRDDVHLFTRQVAGIGDDA
jgi:hypothetical protein